MNAVIGTLPRHYERLGLIPGVIQPWEDGLRTAAADGTFEWWYFDAHLDDGSTVTIEFHTKPPYVSPKAALTPFVLVTETKQCGTRMDYSYLGDVCEFAASEDGCNVSIGPNTFRGDFGGYEVHVEVEGFVGDFTLRPEVAPWRPETGHALFGADEQHFLAWLPVVPRGAVEAVVSVAGRTRKCVGTGYHDHNWGNIAPRKVLDHWYWGRATVGDYTVTTLMFTSDARYDYARLPAVMVAKGNDIIASAVGPQRISFEPTDIVVHGETGVPMAKRLRYCVNEGEHEFRITFNHEHNGFALDFGTSGAYLRFTGDATIEHHHADAVTTASAKTLWELLYFGDRTESERTSQRSTVKEDFVVGHQA